LIETCKGKLKFTPRNTQRRQPLIAFPSTREELFSKEKL
jgi:hypothetical protein